MKSKLKGKIFAILVSLAMVFTMMPMMTDTAYAREDSNTSVMKAGNVINFAKDAPISTITIDRSKIHKDNLVFSEPGKLDQLPNVGNCISFTFADGYAYAEGVTVNADYKSLGNFSFVYKDAAIMSDGTKENLEVIFDAIHVIREKSQPTYYNEKIRIAYAGDSGNGKPLALTPLSVNNQDKHFAIRSEIKFRVGKTDVVSGEEESFFFTASDINIKNNSAIIVNDHGNQKYSESIEPMYGINSESDIYIPQSTNITDNPSGGEWNRTYGGYGHRFMVDSRITNPSTNPYDFGLATVVRAGGSSGRVNNGFITRVWVSSGPDFEQSEIHFLNYDLTHRFTSSSGADGIIELWTDGQIHDTDAEEHKFRRLNGGDVYTPYTYAVPHGKEVTYKMTPDSGFILDTLTVNGAKKDPTNIVYKENSTEVDYYEYTFREDTVNENKTISVTWKLTTPTPKPTTPTPKPTPDKKVSGTLIAKMKAGKTSLTTSWNKVKGVDGYDIFLAQCNHHGKKLVCKKVKTIKGNKNFKWTKSGLKKGTAYKSYVKAYVMKNGKKTYVKTSPMMHAYTGNGTKKYTNAKSVTVKKSKVSLKKGKTYKIKASVKKMKKNKKLMPKSHAATLRYLTSNKKVATVSKSGKITAKGKGSCVIYVFAHNGVSKQVKVTVN